MESWSETEKIGDDLLIHLQYIYAISRLLFILFFLASRILNFQLVGCEEVANRCCK